MSDEIVPQVPGEAETEAPQPKKSKKSGLPDQSTVDPDKIKRAVLTQQGYVVPTDLGKKPA